MLGSLSRMAFAARALATNVSPRSPAVALPSAMLW
jgi:hypothetical protein